MGMPITVDVVGAAAPRCSTRSSPISRASTGASAPTRPTARSRRSTAASLAEADYSAEMREVLALAEQTKLRDRRLSSTCAGRTAGSIPPASSRAGRSAMPRRSSQRAGVRDFFIEAGGDIQSSGKNAGGQAVEGRHPQSLQRRRDHQGRLSARARRSRPPAPMCAASTSTIRIAPGHPIVDIVSLTVIGADVLEADRFATAAFAMGKAGIGFIERDAGPRGLHRRPQRPRHPHQRLRRLLRAMTEAHRPPARPHDDVPAGALLSGRRCSLAAIVLGFFGLVPHDPTAIAFSTVLILAVCWITNWVFARVFGVPANGEFDLHHRADPRPHPRSGAPRDLKRDRRADLRLASGRWRRSTSSPSAASISSIPPPSPWR